MAGNVERLSHRHIEQKRWGWEEWIVNNDLYCGKRLHFTRDGGSTSLHFHAKKHETMYVEFGEFEVLTVDVTTGLSTSNVMSVGDSIVIPQNVPHRIIVTRTPAVLVEFSTHHENDDSYRVIP